MLGLVTMMASVTSSGSSAYLYHVLDNLVVKYGKHFLGRALGRRQEAGAQARGGDDGLH